MRKGKAAMTDAELQILKNKVLKGYRISKEEALQLENTDLRSLCRAADEIRRSASGRDFDMCAVISVRGGRCSENCSFCPQASCASSEIRTFPLLSSEPVQKMAVQRDRQGVRHFGLVSSGRKMDKAGIAHICQVIREVREKTEIHLCASLGLLDREDLHALKDAGVERIHNNLETSERFFPQLCTTHTYEDKKKVIRMAHQEGLEVCSGGIIGAGETFADRVDLALAERELGTESVPVNMLHPVKGTPLEDQKRLSPDEVRRTIAVFRFILPRAWIRLAAGRDFLPDEGRDCFCSGSNASITGDMLNVRGISVEEDIRLIHELLGQQDSAAGWRSGEM